MKSRRWFLLSGVAAAALVVTEAQAGFLLLSFQRSLIITGNPTTVCTISSPIDSWTPTVTGGIAPYTYDVASGAFPTGVTINASTGLVSGTPSVAGTFASIVVRATDSSVVPNVATMTPFSMLVQSPAQTITITGTPTTTGQVGSAVTPFTVTGHGGTPPYTYTVNSGTLPDGVTLNSSTGITSGTPTMDGTYAYIALRVIDSLGAVGDLAAFNWAIQYAPGALTAVLAQPAYGVQLRPAGTYPTNTVFSLHGISMSQRNNSEPDKLDPHGSGDFGAYGLMRYDSCYPLTGGPAAGCYLAGTGMPIPIVLTTGLKYPWVTGAQTDVYIRGGQVLGSDPYNADRALTTDPVPRAYVNSAGFDLGSNPSFFGSAFGIRIDSVWDGIRPGAGCGISTGLPGQQIQARLNLLPPPSLVTSCWISNAMDDAIENDGLLSLTVTDTLVDGCHSFISSDNSGTGLGSAETLSMITVTNCLVRMASQPDSNNNPTPPYPYYFTAWKFNANAPSLQVNGTTIMVEGYNASLGDAKARWKIGWQRAANGRGSSANNKFLWNSDAAFPATYFFPPDGTTPPGWTVYTGTSTCQGIWDLLKSVWISNHPYIFKISPTDGT